MSKKSLVAILSAVIAIESVLLALAVGWAWRAEMTVREWEATVVWHKAALDAAAADAGPR